MIVARRLPLLVLAATLGCGDDQDDLDSGPSVADGAESTSTAVTDDAATADDDAADDGADDDAETTAGGAGGSGSSGSADATSGEDAQVACLPAHVFDALQQHLVDLRTASYVLAGEPDEDTMTGFLLAPGLPTPPAVPFLAQGPMEPCEAPVALPVVCDLGSCTLLQCMPNGWITQLWVIPPVLAGDWLYTRARVQTEWIAGETGTTFRIGTIVSTEYGAEISMSGKGAMDEDGFSVEEEFLALHEAGTVTLTYAEGVDGATGALGIGEVTVAEADATGQLQPTGECPWL
jgi:hypothetical protein